MIKNYTFAKNAAKAEVVSLEDKEPGQSNERKYIGVILTVYVDISKEK